MNRIALFIPLVVFAVLSLFLLKGLDRDPTELPSALVGEPFPAFVLPSLGNQQQMLTERDLDSKVVLVNVWATWCFACRIEHPMLNQLAAEGVSIIGLNYKDDTKNAKKFLDDLKNPYSNIFLDKDGLISEIAFAKTFKNLVRDKKIVVSDEMIERQARKLYEGKPNVLESDIAKLVKDIRDEFM